MHPAPSIGSDDTYIKDGGVGTTCDSSASAISTSASSSDGYCSDHQDCNSWGPATFEESGALDALLADVNVRKLPTGFYTEGLVRELTANTDTENPFFVVNLSTVMKKLNDWKNALPRVKPLYAMKCNSDEKICRVLAQAGCGFDCASKGEIILAQELGVTSENIIYANPCKQANMLRYAREVGVRLMTADNVEELHKIRDIFPEARIVLRIAVDDSKSVCRFNSKFGAPPAEWDAFLRTAKELALDVAGVSFHVGSGCGDLQPFADAVASARDCFDLMSTRYGFSPNYLDIGGGWPGHDKGSFTFKDVAAVVGEAIDQHFPASCGVEIVAEPGRYFAHASHTLAVKVIAKRQLSKAQLADTAEIESFGARPTKDTISTDDGFKKAEASENQPEVALYINDGVYGVFNCVVFDHAHVYPKALERRSGVRTVNTKLFGPTCDSIDVVMPSTRLPEMNVGEWLWFEGMGAYTRLSSLMKDERKPRFNGQGAFDIHYVWAGMP
jgi:ornithine decarboxylase